MSSLSLMTAQGFMPVTSTLYKTYGAAWQTTQTLAAQSTPVNSGAVLAAQDVMSLRGAPTPSLASFKASDPTFGVLNQAVARACVPGGDGRACSAAAQQLGSYEALVTGPDGPVTAALLNKRDNSSIREWFAPPTRVLPTKVTTPQVGAVAVSLGAIKG